MSSVLPGLRVGAHALVGAGSVVTKDVPAFALATGNPAVVVKDVRDIRSRSELDGDGQPVPHYPWPRRFSRGMPWAGVGFSNWCETEGLDEFGLPSERRTR
jgi:hypothetical protein